MTETLVATPRWNEITDSLLPGEIPLDVQEPLTYNVSRAALRVEAASETTPGAILTTAQTLAGVKTFLAAPKCSAEPTELDDLATVEYVTTHAVQAVNWLKRIAAIADITTVAAPLDGDRYISELSGSGFTANYIYTYSDESNGWVETIPSDGDTCYVDAIAAIRTFNDTVWISPVTIQSNPFAVSSARISSSLGAPNVCVQALAIAPSDALWHLSGYNLLPEIGNTTAFTEHNTPQVSGDTIILASGAYLRYTLQAGIDNANLGTIRATITPHWSGTPAQDVHLFSLGRVEGGLPPSANQLELFVRASDGVLCVRSLNASSVETIIELNNYVWAASTPVEIELDWGYNVMGGSVRLFTNGAQHGVATGLSITRGATTYFTVGNSNGVAYGFSVKRLSIFGTHQHAVAYTMQRTTTIGATDVAADTVHVASAVNSTSSSTGALIVGGGIGAGGSIQSAGQVACATGFVTSAGVQAASATLSGALTAASAIFAGEVGAGLVSVTSTVYAAECILAESLSALSATLTSSLTAASATLTGALSSASAAITGALTAGSATINGAVVNKTDVRTYQSSTADSSNSRVVACLSPTTTFFASGRELASQYNNGTDTFNYSTGDSVTLANDSIVLTPVSGLTWALAIGADPGAVGCLRMSIIPTWTGNPANTFIFAHIVNVGNTSFIHIRGTINGDWVIETGDAAGGNYVVHFLTQYTGWTIGVPTYLEYFWNATTGYMSMCANGQICTLTSTQTPFEHVSTTNLTLGGIGTVGWSMDFALRDVELSSETTFVSRRQVRLDSAGLMLPSAGSVGVQSALDYYEEIALYVPFTGGTTSGDFNAILVRLGKLVTMQLVNTAIEWDPANGIYANGVIPARFRPRQSVVVLENPIATLTDASAVAWGRIQIYPATGNIVIKSAAGQASASGFLAATFTWVM